MSQCFHCKTFMPVWKKVCRFYTDKGYMLISVETNMSGLLPENMQDVRAFPTLRAYDKTKPIEDFNGMRTFDAVANFIETYGKPISAPKKKPAPSRPKSAPAKPKSSPATAKAAAKKKKKPASQ